MKTCIVVYALPERQWLWHVTLPDAGTVEDALARARAQAGALVIPWDLDVGIFGELCERVAVPRDGDRIELYRPLKADPKESRRARARAVARARDPAAARPAPDPKSR